MAREIHGQQVLRATDLAYRTASMDTLVYSASLTVCAGDIVAIVGPNGAGKSTLLRMLAGLLIPTSGSIDFLGQPLSTLTGAERARSLAYVDQLDRPDRRLTINEYVGLGRIPHATQAPITEHERAIADALARVELTDRAHSRIAHLSGGELQRAILARALCQEPQLLFLDEPTNHLDPKAKGTLLSLLVEQQRSVVCVLHDLSLVPNLATHTVLMNQGQVIACGKTETVLTQDNVREVFGIDVLHLAHPTENRVVTVLDIPVSQPHTPQ